MIAATRSGVRLTVHVRPGAATSAITAPHGDAVGARIAAPPVDGRANDELVALLAKRLGVPRRAVTLVAGAASRRKLVDVAGVDVAAATRLLGSSG